METQNEGQSQGRIVDTLRNQDKVLKESLSLFKGGSLDFLDEELSGEVTDILSTEITETTTKKAYADNALKLSTNTGIHSEWEADISSVCLLRKHGSSSRPTSFGYMMMILNGMAHTILIYPVYTRYHSQQL